MEIKITRTHECDEECQYSHFLQFRAGVNPDYNKETGKCPKSGKEEDSSPPIAHWSENREAFNLYNPKEIVIPQQKINIVFRYPFEKEFVFEFKANTSEGFTKEYLIDCICNQYEKMYKEENEATPPTSMEERMKRGGLVNRESTEGPYGIWGHDIEDLYLEGIEYNEKTNTVHLFIGS